MVERWPIECVHDAVPGRARFKVARLERRPDLAKPLEEHLAGRPHVRSAQVNPRTGNVLIHFASHLGTDVAEQALESALESVGFPEAEMAQMAAAALEETAEEVGEGGVGLSPLLLLTFAVAAGTAWATGRVRVLLAVVALMAVHLAMGMWRRKRV
jgi:hypothetical protein